MVPVPNPEERRSFLSNCLLGGDPAQEKRARRVKQRALVVSIILQILIVAALVLVPLLGKGENIAERVIFTPTVPYAPGGSPNHPKNPPRPAGDHSATCRICAPTSIPPTIITHDSDRAPDPGESVDLGPGIPGLPPGEGVIGGRTPDFIPTPPREKPDEVQPTVRQQVSEFNQTAMLIYRVQPAYPPLALQIHREGRVELHAIIATDGTIQSLQVISGEAWFVKSALDAVGLWRYRPTILNGRAVEVDTHITVIYTLTH